MSFFGGSGCFTGPSVRGPHHRSPSAGGGDERWTGAANNLLA
jgi:hypothetical protein